MKTKAFALIIIFIIASLLASGCGVPATTDNSPGQNAEETGTRSSEARQIDSPVTAAEPEEEPANSPTVTEPEEAEKNSEKTVLNEEPAAPETQEEIAAESESAQTATGPELSVLLTRDCLNKVTQNIEQVGLEAGDTAVDFTLKDIDGNPVNLSAMLAYKPVLMIFGSFT